MDFLRADERLSRLIRMYLIFSLIFSLIRPAHLANNCSLAVFGELEERMVYTSKDLRDMQTYGVVEPVGIEPTLYP